MVYLDEHILLCLFHRKQAWNRWLDKHDNGCARYKGEIMVLLVSVAESADEVELKSNINMFKQSLVWRRSQKLQRYFTNFWEPYMDVSNDFLLCCALFPTYCYF